MLVGSNLLQLKSMFTQFNTAMKNAHQGDIEKYSVRCTLIKEQVNAMIALAETITDEAHALKNTLPKPLLVDVRKTVKKVIAIRDLIETGHHYGFQFLLEIDRNTAINDFVIDMEIAFRERLDELGKTECVCSQKINPVPM